MKKTTIFKFFSGLLISALLLGSCTTEVDWDNLLDDVKFDQSLVIPIGEASTTIEEVLNQLDSTDFIGTEENSIFIKFTDSAEWVFRKIVLLEGATPIYDQFYPSESSTYTAPANTVISYTINKSIDLGINSDVNSERIDTIIAKSAKIKILLKENFNLNASNVTYTLSFPSSTLVFEDNTTAHTFQATALNVEEEFTIPPFKMFKMYTQDENNKIPIKIEVRATTGNNPTIFTPLSSISTTIHFSEINYKMIYGFFKPKISLEAEEETIDLGDIQSSIPKGLFRVSEPTIDVTVKNYIGVKINANLEFVKAYRISEPTYEPVFATFKNGSHNKSFILSPSTKYGVPAITKFTLDKDSGEINKLFDRELLPNTLDYKYYLSNVPTTETNFLTDDSKIKILMDLKVPLHLKGGSYIEINDTIKDLNINDVLDKDYIDNAVLVLNLTNGIPVGANFKIKLLQANATPVPNTSIDSIFIVNAPNVDANGLVIKNDLKVQTLKINIKKDQLSQLRAAKHIAYTLRVDRKDDKQINFELTNSFAVKAGLFLKAGILVNDLKSNN